jgi:hypothetical protein
MCEAVAYGVAEAGDMNGVSDSCRVSVGGGVLLQAKISGFDPHRLFLPVCSEKYFDAAVAIDGVCC